MAILKGIIFLLCIIFYYNSVFAFNDFSFNSAFHKATAGAFKSHSESLIKLREKKAKRRGLFLKGEGYISTSGGDLYIKNFCSNIYFNAIHFGLCGFYFYDGNRIKNKLNILKYNNDVFD
ncbi:hypothetical protein [Brachyspira innocens]|uniref:hypothetical protein n=1 Tax=Brachyspira innocens TaxID=13264 RepID=UPI0026F34D43|nr:hypothetical protein [Brachyspira innocens]